MQFQTHLARRTYASIYRDIDVNAVETCQTYPVVPEGQHLTDLEWSIRDWAMLFGIAYGIARAEDAFEPEDEVCARALEAAKEAYTRYRAQPDGSSDTDIFDASGYLADRITSRDGHLA